MKKKIAALIFSVTILSSLLIGCDLPNLAETEKSYDTEDENIKSIFVEVEKSGNWTVVYDKETRVMYTVSSHGSGSGVFNLLVDENGKPKLWDGE